MRIGRFVQEHRIERRQHRPPVEEDVPVDDGPVEEPVQPLYYYVPDWPVPAEWSVVEQEIEV